MKWVYFVSYEWQSETGHGRGRCEVKWPRAIDSIEDIAGIEEGIRSGEPGTPFTKVLITFFQFLRSEAGK